jgi:hypothetical protein
MISLNEIRKRADIFSHEFANETDEKGEAAPFWEEFFQVFGVSRRRVASFEYRVKKADGAQGFIDVFWPGVLLAEHKTQGRDLDKAYQQALTYLDGLKDGELPQYIVVSDFARMRLYDLEEKDEFEFPLQALSKHVERFGFISGYEVQKYEQEEQASIKAAELMAGFHNAIAETGYEGHPLEVFLTRILFCLFSEDTGIFDRRQFQHYIEQRTNDDGSDLGIKILELFYVLNTPANKRQNNLDEQLAAFPYINGRVFEERLNPISLDKKARETLLECCAFDWSQISAAIFGSLFQGVMDQEERRELGAHYTSELNIMKVIQPLFLDELYTEFDTAKKSQQRLETFHKKLSDLRFLDPACGCGNFLVTTYRELRKLEIEVLKSKQKLEQSKANPHASATVLSAFGAEELSKIHVNQFYGLEIEEFPVLVARTAMYLADHQMNQAFSKQFGISYARIPLEEPATIVHGNALTMQWEDVVEPLHLDFILGNPPFIGYQWQTKEQKAQLASLFGDNKWSKSLDFVTGWYVKAMELMKKNENIQSAFVSTNSIIQGEQVPILWKHLFDKGVHINFLHQTFKWSNEARGNAAVYCTIIGFALVERKEKQLFTYELVNGTAEENIVSTINAYGIEAPNIFIEQRKKPLFNVPEMKLGSMPKDGGNFFLDQEVYDEVLAAEPEIEKYIKKFIGANEFLYDKKRYCLWLKDANPKDIKKSKFISNRVAAVKKFRLESKAQSTREAASTSTLFKQFGDTEHDYLVIPRVTSENRTYIPIGYMTPDTITGDACYTLPKANLYHFGVLTSLMHMTWVKYTCGRLESRFRYSKDIVYNNFAWPMKVDGTPDSVTSTLIELAAQNILDIRAKYEDSTLADLYDQNSMPPDLAMAHKKLDKIVDSAYNYTDTKSETDRIVFLFGLYQSTQNQT